MVRSFLYSCEGLKKVFCEVDFVVMFLRIEGFGLIGFEVLLVGLFVFVSWNFGFGEIIKNLLFGFLFVIDFEDFIVWVKVIEDVWNKERRDWF